MGNLLRLRDALALRGQADAAQLSAQLKLSAAMTEAMLERLVGLGLAERIATGGGKKGGGCRHCPQNRQCGAMAYRLTASGYQAGLSDCSANHCCR